MDIYPVKKKLFSEYIYNNLLSQLAVGLSLKFQKFNDRCVCVCLCTRAPCNDGDWASVLKANKCYGSLCIFFLFLIRTEIFT